MLIEHLPSSGALEIGVSVDTTEIWREDPTGNGLPLVGFSPVCSALNSVHWRELTTASDFYGGNTKSVSSQVVRGFKPTKNPYSYARDTEKYSSILTAPFGVGVSSSLAREKQTSHWRSGSTLREFQLESLYSFRNDETLVGGNFPLFTVSDRNIYSQGYTYVPSSLTPGTSSPISYVLGSHYRGLGAEPLSSMLLRLEKLQDHVSSLPFAGLVSPAGPLPDLRMYGYPVYFWPYNQFVYVGDIVHSVSSNTISFSNLFIKNDVFGAIARRTNFDLEFVLRSDPLMVEGYEHWRRSVQINYSVTRSWYTPTSLPVISDGLRGWLNFRSESYSGSTSSRSTNYALTKVSDSVINTTQLDKKIESLRRNIDAKRGFFAQNLGDLRPSAMYSYSDAISKMRATDANYIETLVEAGELISLIPSAVSVIKAFLSRKPRDVVDASLRLGDLLADSKLWYQFGLSPTLATPSDLYQMVDRVGPAIRSLQSGGAYHGKFSFRIKDDPIFGSVNLTTRTKVRVRGMSDDFLLSAMKLDALGLLPTTSRLWDPILMSWFIDYFVNLGNRYEVIDSVLIGLMRGVDLCVHSFKVYDPDRSPIRAAGFDSSEFVTELYFREVSRLVPSIFRTSRIDYGVPLHGPDSGIISALLWGLFMRPH